MTFDVHINSASDRLVVGEPLISRASGEMRDGHEPPHCGRRTATFAGV